MGRKSLPFYRLVATDSRKSRDGKYLEKLGHYDPMQEDFSKKFFVDKEKVAKWISNGAKASDTVKAFFSKVGIQKDLLDEKKSNKKKKPRKKRYTPLSEMIKRKQVQKAKAEEGEKKKEAYASKKASEETKESSQKESSQEQEKKSTDSQSVKAPPTPEVAEKADEAKEKASPVDESKKE